MLCIYISSIEINVKKLNHLDNVTNNNNDDLDHDHDPMKNGINDIMKVIEILNQLSMKEYTSMDDPNDEEQKDGDDNTVELLRYPRSITFISSSSTSTSKFNSEYQDIPCHFQCILRSKRNHQEIRKISKTTLHLPNKKTAILDCYNSTTTTMATSMMTTTSSPLLNIEWKQSIISQCVRHFTKRLLHLIIGTLSNDSNMVEWFIFTSNQFSSSIYDAIQAYIQSTTDLYITFTIPIYRLDRNDFNRLSPWLRYISIDGKQLRYIDVMVIANLTLDYFILQDCIRKDEIIMNPLVTTLPDSRIELYNKHLDCLVYWIYSCPNYSSFILIADLKTQRRYCRIFNTVEPSMGGSSSTIEVSTMQPLVNNLRAKRSLKRNKPKWSILHQSNEETPPSLPPPPTTTTTTRMSTLKRSSMEPSVSRSPSESSESKMVNHSNASTMNNQALLSPIKDCTSIGRDLQQYLNDHCEQKLTWLTNIITILLIILLVVIIILFGLLFIFSYFIKQYLLLQRENKIR
ncbi:unnamed protein product [Schistosoma rodhaini]|uniref:Protein kinase domain-containing protein n=1 Tax=Schistosoma rodhaini TaxID=6188 RepID=A0A183RNF2_9TREM|nr:unnamed protein product [Schistosoma rodhaini]